MSLSAPNLDDRPFQELVDQAKRQIPRFCPTWTDHNVSDPGITLIELFAYMTEQYIYRLNQVPDKNFITFLDLIGVRLQPAQPARSDVTFTLSAFPTEERRLIIPQWTAVATERTETEEAIVYTTDAEAEVMPPNLRWLLTGIEEQDFIDHSDALKDDSPFEIWENPPASSQAIYFGFDQDLSAHTLVLQLRCEKVGIGIKPDNVPWRWQAWRGQEFGWEQLVVASDSTDGFNQDGEVSLMLPYRCQPHRFLLREARTWVRCAPIDKPAPGVDPYARSPRLRRAAGYTIGVTVPVTHAQAVGPEVVGISNGQPSQKFHLQYQNILEPEGPQEAIQVETEDGGWAGWEFVPNFGSSKSTDTHCILDPINGEIEFGPAIRQRDGTEPQFGAIPPRGRTIRMLHYRVGGGVRGNVADGRVKVLKTTLPYVASVINRSPIVGGLEAQSLEDAKMRGPGLLRTRFRAVTAEDYEYLAGEVEGVGRVRCLQPSLDDPEAPAPGTVLLLVIPGLPGLDGPAMDRHIELHEAITQEGRRAASEAALQRELQLAPATEVRLRNYLDERRLLTTRIGIQSARYVWVTVQTRIRTAPKAEAERVRRQVQEALYRYLHPLFGGPDGKGWPFGRPLTIDKVYALIQSVPGVEYATELNLYPINITDASGQRLGAAQQVIQVPPDGVIVSYYHNVYLAR